MVSQFSSALSVMWLKRYKLYMLLMLCYSGSSCVIPEVAVLFWK